MGSNYKKSQKHSNKIAAIITLSVVLVAAFIDIIFYKNVSIDYYIESVPLILYAIVLFFVRIKSYGYGIASAACFGTLIEPIMNNNFFESNAIGRLVCALVLLFLLLYKNIKKQNNKQ